MKRFLALAWLLAFAAGSAFAAKTGPETKPDTVTVKLLAGRFYPADQRLAKSGFKVCAILRVVPAEGGGAQPTFLYLTEDSEIEVGDIGGFSMKAMTQPEFKELFTKGRVVTAQRTSCVPSDPRIGCVTKLAVSPD